MGRIRCRVVLAVVCVCFMVMTGQAGGQAVRVLHFPKRRSVGTLYVQDCNGAGARSNLEWEYFSEAIGDVVVPAGSVLRLDWSKEKADDLSPLSRLKQDDLVQLNFEGVELADDQLENISHLKGLRELDLSETNILGTGLKYLAGLDSMENLWLGGTQVGDNELEFLVDISALKGLGLRDTPTNDAGMIHIGKIASLEVLSISPGVGDEGLEHLKGLTKLRWLSAGNQGITDKGLSYLSNMTQMETLELRGSQVSDNGLVYLKQMKQLKMLSLYGTRVTERGFTHLEGLENLETLNVLYGVTDVGLIHLSKLPSLKNITIDGESVTAKGLGVLSQMKSLEHVYVDNTDKMDDIVGRLSRLPQLRKLTCGRGLTDEGLLQLKGAVALCDLDIMTANITSRGLGALAEMASLRSLKLANMKLASEEEWKALGAFLSLESLTLRAIRSEVSDAHIAYLGNLRRLKELAIDAIVIKDRRAMYSMDVTDKSLGYICSLKSLEYLELSGTRFTDEGIQKLSQLSMLKQLYLKDYTVTEQSFQSLQKKLPGLRCELFSVKEE